MPYVYKRVHTPIKDFVTRTKCFYYTKPNEKKSRGVRMAPTPEGKQKRNARASYLGKKYLIYNNFSKGDWWITLTWNKDKLPADPKEAHKTLMRIMSNIRKKLSRRGIEFYYFAKTEAGERQRVHHHLLIKNTFDVISVLYEYWEELGKVKDFSRIYNLQNGKLVKYILDGGEHKELNFEKYSHSRNLVKPEIETRIYPARSFKENPKPPKSDDPERYEWVIENLNNFYPDIDGYIYQEYELVRREKNIEKDSSERDYSDRE